VQGGNAVGSNAASGRLSAVIARSVKRGCAGAQRCDACGAEAAVTEKGRFLFLKFFSGTRNIRREKTPGRMDGTGVTRG